MQTHTIIFITAIALVGTGAASYFLRDDALPRQADALKRSSSSTSSLITDDTPLHDARRDQSTNPEQQRVTLLSEKMADLEARLRHMEATASDQAKDPTMSQPDELDMNNSAKKPKTKRLSEEDFGRWLDQALDTGDFDRDATQSAREEIDKSLAAVPGMNLADMQCGVRFCRARFASDNGKRPHMTQLIGASPLMESGFTLNESDGSVRVYFTQPGQSLRELRSEAQESTLKERRLQ